MTECVFSELFIVQVFLLLYSIVFVDYSNIIIIETDW